MNTTIKAPVFLLYAILSLNSLYALNPVKELYIGRNWEFIEAQLLEKPYHQSLSFYSYAKKIMIGLTSGALMAYTTNYATQRCVPTIYKTVKLRDLTTVIAIPCLTFATALANYTKTGNYLEQMFYVIALKEFIDEWPVNKQITPIEFHASFDTLYELYRLEGESPYVQEVFNEMIKPLHKAIFNHFPAKYAHNLQALDNNSYYSASYLHTIVTFDITNFLQSFVEMIKLFRTDH